MIFGVALGSRPRRRQDGPGDGPGPAPIRRQDGPKTTQDVPNTDQDGPKTSQDAPQMPQEALKTSPKTPLRLSRGPGDAPGPSKFSRNLQQSSKSRFPASTLSERPKIPRGSRETALRSTGIPQDAPKIRPGPPRAAQDSL